MQRINVPITTTPIEPVELQPIPAAKFDVQRTAQILEKLNRAMEQRTPKPWYYPTHREALELSFYIVQDLAWSIFSQLSINCKFQHTDSFWEATAAQQLWTSVVVFMWAPLNVYIWSRVFGEKYKNFAIHGAIFTVSSLATMVPWNYFAYLGKNFFMNHGVNENSAQYLAALFPGPGTAEGILQTTITTGLSYAFDPNYKFNAISFGVGLSPIAYLDGDVWLVVFNAMAGVAKKNVGGLIAQAILVMLSALITNFLTMKATDAIGKHFAAKDTIRPREGINLFKMPKRYDYEPRRHAEAQAELPRAAV